MTNDNYNLVPESHGPFGEYYVHPAKRERSQQLRAALKALDADAIIRPSITQEIIDNSETISANLVDTQDGDGIPYWNEPDGAYSPSTEAEDEMEQGRR